MTVKCTSGFACMGAGKCVPDAAFALPDAGKGQNAASLATRPDGAWAVAWYDGTIDTEMHIQIQVSLQSNSVVTPALQVDDPGPHTAYAPSLVALADGTWLVIWRDEQWMQNQVRFQGRRVATDGSHVLGPAFEITQGWQKTGDGSTNIVSPVAVRLRDDAILVAWPQGDAQTGAPTVHARRLDQFGALAGPELDVGAGGPNLQAASPAIAPLPLGESLLVWQESTGKGPVRIRGRHFSADGTPLGTVQTYSAAAQDYEALPDVTAFADGAILASWKSGNDLSSTTAVDVKARRFGADLLQTSAAALQAVGTDPSGTYPDQAATVALPTNRAALVWHTAQFPGSDVFLRRYYREPDALDCETTIVAGPPLPGEDSARYLPDAEVLADGRVLVAWNVSAGGLPVVRVKFLPW